MWHCNALSHRLCDRAKYSIINAHDQGQRFGQTWTKPRNLHRWLSQKVSDCTLAVCLPLWHCHIAPFADISQGFHDGNNCLSLNWLLVCMILGQVCGIMQLVRAHNVHAIDRGVGLILDGRVQLLQVFLPSTSETSHMSIACSTFEKHLISN